MISCIQKSDKNIQGKWIQGSEEEKLETIEMQFRGFDMVMFETGYRYQELYWAGQDQNWEYADYQLEKIRKTIKNGLIRRPKRAQSAEQFMNEVIPKMEVALDSKDTTLFNSSFIMLTKGCLNCHTKENVPHFTVKKPLNRVSPIRK